MSDENTGSIEQKILRKIYLWLMVGGVGIGGVAGSGVMRVDKFGYSDFESEIEIIESRIMLEIKAVQLDCRNRIDKSESRKPPGLTRQRIQAVEESARRTDPAYKQPTWEWQ